MAMGRPISFGVMRMGLGVILITSSGGMVGCVNMCKRKEFNWKMGVFFVRKRLHLWYNSLQQHPPLYRPDPYEDLLSIKRHSPDMRDSMIRPKLVYPRVAHMAQTFQHFREIRQVQGN
ncbi:hypothetical protein B0H63DRAFT_446481 [Podospora didyma]|uniref:Uncharacterized protein n=1 Tax=Podospora didyma TaxID=330526 RepID=A0AAE0U466_9PEZI|nr:hypothetical protein B0H63DRAFT_446481 [Podospora didyma]